MDEATMRERVLPRRPTSPDSVTSGEEEAEFKDEYEQEQMISKLLAKSRSEFRTFRMILSVLGPMLNIFLMLLGMIHVGVKFSANMLFTAVCLARLWTEERGPNAAAGDDGTFADGQRRLSRRKSQTATTTTLLWRQKDRIAWAWRGLAVFVTLKPIVDFWTGPMAVMPRLMLLMTDMWMAAFGVATWYLVQIRKGNESEIESLKTLRYDLKGA